MKLFVFIPEAATESGSGKQVFWNLQPKSLNNAYEEVHFQ